MYLQTYGWCMYIPMKLNADKDVQRRTNRHTAIGDCVKSQRFRFMGAKFARHTRHKIRNALHTDAR